LLAVAVVGAPALAQTRTGTLIVQLTVSAACSAGFKSGAFPAHEFPARDVRVRCSGPVPYRIETGPDASAAMTGPSHTTDAAEAEVDIVTITYSITSDAPVQ
jgi:hypothetical protein